MRVISGLAGLIVLVTIGAPVPSAAQEFDPSGEVYVGSELESYLRTLQLNCVSAGYAWTIRSLSLEEMEDLAYTDSTHPWRSRWTRREGMFVPIRPELSTIFNSSFPYGGNDGAVWVGKGVTTVVRGGFTGSKGAASWTISPIGYYSQNASFELMRHSLSERGEFLDPRQPNYIDLPQRFGSSSFFKVDPGESSVRVRFRGASAGLSTASQQWGAAKHHPLVLGNNSGGFPHLFLGTARPANVYIGDIHARIIWGRIGQSQYSPVAGDSASRFATGLVAVFIPRFAPGMEVGVGRFFHTPWTSEGLRLSHFTKTFEGFLKAGIPGKDIIPDEYDPDRPFDPDNQIASVFFRWLLPHSGLELYGEFARDDHNWDAEDLILEPDHSSGYSLGLAKGWELEGNRLLTLRGEYVDTRIKPLDQVRPQAPFYIHGWTRQGHTNRGQLLGSVAGYSGSATTFDLEYHHAGGRITGRWARHLRQTDDLYASEGIARAPSADVQHALGVDALAFRGGWDVNGGITVVYNFNRNFGPDMSNLRLDATVRAPL